MKIALDVMGGDYGPEATVKGAILARQKISSETGIVLIGDESIIRKIMAEESASSDGFEIVHSPEFIEMGENPSKSFVKKPNSSIAIGFGMLAKGLVQAFASAGNTGAMLVGAMYTVKSVPGVLRPCITGVMPRPNGKSGVLLDVGLNADCKPEILYQFGILGSVYAEFVFNINNPRVGLINIGEEEEKGNILTKAAFELMKGTKQFNFVGNVEGFDVFDDGKADVMVCDGFVGNVLLKAGESFYPLSQSQGMKGEFFERFNFENYGGSPILGVNGNVIIGHGASNPKAIMNMLILSKEVAEANLPEKFQAIFLCS